MTPNQKQEDCTAKEIWIFNEAAFSSPMQRPLSERIIDGINALKKHWMAKQAPPTDPSPWTLPSPPAGREWHRNDFTEEMLRDGWRPLLLGEKIDGGDEFYLNVDLPIETPPNKKGWYPHYAELGVNVMKGHPPTRTRRPLPTPDSGDKCPTCGSKSQDVRHTVRNMALEEVSGALGKYPCPDKWHDQTGDKWAREKQAHKEGKRIQFRMKSGERWLNCVLACGPVWHKSREYRIHPEDDTPQAPSGEKKIYAEGQIFGPMEAVLLPPPPSKSAEQANNLNPPTKTNEHTDRPNDGKPDQGGNQLHATARDDTRDGGASDAPKGSTGPNSTGTEVPPMVAPKTEAEPKSAGSSSWEAFKAWWPYGGDPFDEGGREENLMWKAWQAAIAWASRHGEGKGWIRSTERKPTHPYSVLGWVTGGPLVHGDPMIDIVTYFPESDWWMQSVSGEDVQVPVPYWMDLPPTPIASLAPVQGREEDPLAKHVRTDHYLRNLLKIEAGIDCEGDLVEGIRQLLRMMQLPELRPVSNLDAILDALYQKGMLYPGLTIKDCMEAVASIVPMQDGNPPFIVESYHVSADGKMEVRSPSPQPEKPQPTLENAKQMLRERGFLEDEKPQGWPTPEHARDIFYRATADIQQAMIPPLEGIQAVLDLCLAAMQQLLLKVQTERDRLKAEVEELSATLLNTVKQRNAHHAKANDYEDQLTALRQELERKGWISVKERMPTKEDADALLQSVIYRMNDGTVFQGPWDSKYFDGGCASPPHHWMPIPPLPAKPEPDKEREEFEAAHPDLHPDWLGDRYGNNFMQAKWEGWQAARKGKA